jgi:hypothetical protein
MDVVFVLFIIPTPLFSISPKRGCDGLQLHYLISPGLKRCVLVYPLQRSKRQDVNIWDSLPSFTMKKGPSRRGEL